MTLNSKTLAILLVVLLFGGILGSSALGWWQTESTKEPVKFTAGEFAGQANPADIRGSYTFGDIAKSFPVTPEVLAQAFEVPADQDAAAFPVKDLEAIYAGSEFEVGTASVRLFVALYSGLPYDLTTAETTYLPQPAADILLEKGSLTPEQTAFIETHIVPVAGSAPAATLEPTATTPTPAASSAETDTTVKGKTTFGELLSWGVPKDVLEKLINASLPDPAMSVKDYASANSLDFETLKPALQAEVDKYKK